MDSNHNDDQEDLRGSPLPGPSAEATVITEEEEKHIICIDGGHLPNIQWTLVLQFPRAFKVEPSLHPICIQYESLLDLMWETDDAHTTRYKEAQEIHRKLLPPASVREFLLDFKNKAVKRLLKIIDFQKTNDIQLENIKAGQADPTKIPKYLRVLVFEQSLKIPADIESTSIHNTEGRLQINQRQSHDRYQKETLSHALKERLHLQKHLKDLIDPLHIISKFKREFMELQGVRDHGINTLDSGYKIAEGP